MRESLRVTITALRQGPLRRALLAYLVFSIGEWATWVALLVWAYDEHGVGAAAALSVVQLVPAVVVSPFGAVIGDRARRARALAGGYALQGVAMLLTAAILLADGPFLLACAGGVLVTCAISLTRPVHYAVLPAISHTPAELVAGNSASTTAEGVGAFIGPLTCGLLITTGGAGSVFALLGVLLLGAALLALRLPVLPPVGKRHGESLASGALAGVREMHREPAAAVLLGMIAGQYVVIGLLDILLIVLAIDVLGTDRSGPGLLGSAYGLGSVLGALLTVVLVGRRRLSPALAFGLLATGLPLAALAGSDALATAALLLAASGAGKSFFDVAGRTLLQRTVDDQVLARVFGLQEALMSGATALGAALAPLLVAAFGTSGALIAAGLLLPAAGVTGWRGLRLLDARSRLPGPDFDLLRGVPFFRVAPLPVVEQLSRETSAVLVPDGVAVVREGEPGNRFFVVSSGAVAVSREGREVRRLGPGASFGEIALLRDMARTATVTAVGPTVLVALDRTHFLRALGMVPTGLGLAEGIAQEYLDADAAAQRADDS